MARPSNRAHANAYTLAASFLPFAQAHKLRLWSYAGVCALGYLADAVERAAQWKSDTTETTRRYAHACAAKGEALASHWVACPHERRALEAFACALVGYLNGDQWATANADAAALIVRERILSRAPAQVAA